MSRFSPYSSVLQDSNSFEQLDSNAPQKEFSRSEHFFVIKLPFFHMNYRLSVWTCFTDRKVVPSVYSYLLHCSSQKRIIQPSLKLLYEGSVQKARPWTVPLQRCKWEVRHNPRNKHTHTTISKGARRPVSVVLTWSLVTGLVARCMMSARELFHHSKVPRLAVVCNQTWLREKGMWRFFDTAIVRFHPSIASLNVLHTALTSSFFYI